MGGIKEPVLPFSEYGITVIPTRWMRLMMAPLTATLFWSNRSHSVWLAWVPHHTSHNPPFPVKVVTTNSPKTQRVNIKDLRIPPLRILFFPIPHHRVLQPTTSSIWKEDSNHLKDHLPNNTTFSSLFLLPTKKRQLRYLSTYRHTDSNRTQNST